MELWPRVPAKDHQSVRLGERTWCGRGKQKREILGGPAEGDPVEGNPSGRRSWERGSEGKRGVWDNGVRENGPNRNDRKLDETVLG